jgi:NifU-like protein involved in Fe-S cluster formation
MTKDIQTKNGEEWVYSDVVKEHFFNPRNVLKDEENYKADGVGIVGSPACGDVMKVWIKVDGDTKKIVECKWKTFGCASAVASTSMLSVMITENGGMLVDDAYKLKPKDILDRLGGLPDNKIHCSVLGDQALRAAIDDYRQRTKE